MGNPMFRNWLWLALLMAILFGGRAEALRQGEEPIIKDAEVRDESDSVTEESAICIYIGPRPALDTDAPGKVYRQQLAELDLLVTVDRDFAEAERRLSVLRLRAMGPPAYEGQREVVVLATERLAEVQLAQRAPDRALATAGNLLTRRPTASLEADEWFVPAKLEWIEREREWLEDARLISLRKLAAKELARRAQTPELASTTTPSDVTDEIWRDIQKGDGGLVKAMGSAAVPALEQLVVLSIDGVQARDIADPQRDPLTWVMEVAPERALALMAQHADHPSIIWRKRILRALSTPVADWNALSHSYPAASAAARVFIENPDWQQILDTLVTDLSLWEDTRKLLSWSARVELWTPVQTAMVRELLFDGKPEHFALIASRGPGPFWAGTSAAERSLLRDALLDPRPDVRAFAAGKLSDVHDFVGHLGSADPVVIHAFAVASMKQSYEKLVISTNLEDLAPEQLQRWIDAMLTQFPKAALEDRLLLAEALTNPKMRKYVEAEQLRVIVNDADESVRAALFDRFQFGNSNSGPLSDAERRLVRSMIGDPSPYVRQQVLNADGWKQQETQFTREELIRLAGDESPQVRAAVAWVQITDIETRVAAYQVLAADSNADVIQAVESALQYQLRARPELLTAMLPYFEVRLANPSHPALSKPDMPQGNAFEVMKSVRGFTLALQFASANPDTPAIQSVVRFWNYVRTGGIDAVAMLMAQSAEDLAFLLKTGAAELESPAPGGVRVDTYFVFHDVLLQLIQQDSPELERAMVLLANDRTAHRVVRLYACAWLMAQRPDAGLDTVIAVLNEPIWADANLQAQSLDFALRALSRGTALESRNRFALRVVESPEVPTVIASAVTDDYLPGAPGGIEVSRAMLKRWLKPDTAYSPASDALRHVGSLPGEVEPALMRHALRVDSLRNAALSALAQLKDPQFLPDLRDCLNPTWIGYKESRLKFATDSAFAISQYMTDEAAEVLLAGVGIAETDQVRQACFDALERIRLYQEARERIGRHSSGAEKREESVRELVTLLDDPDATTVIAAIRGLAALGAVDELPTLIRLMKHANADVKAAATQAVTRLTEPTPLDDSGGATKDR